MKKELSILFFLASLAFYTANLQAAQTTITKANTTTMNTSADWGGTTPAAGYIGQFDATISAGNEAALTLGGNVTLDQLTFLGTLNGPVTVASGNTLTLGSVSGVGSYGIDMSAANKDVAVNSAITFGTNNTWNVANGRTLTVGGTISGGFTLTKLGSGTNTLTGGSAGTPSSISQISANAGTMNIGGYLNTAKLDLNGGTVNWSGTGTNTANYLAVGDGSASTLNIIAGTLVATPTFSMFIAKGNINSITPLCTVNVTGGSLIMAANTPIYLGSSYNNGGGGSGILTITNTGAFDTRTSTGIFQLGNNGGAGTINLDGGTLSTLRSITPGTNVLNPGTSIFNFNGGTLTANGNNASFISGLTAAYVRNGGAVINDGGYAITVGQSLLHTTNAADNATDGGLIKKGNGTITLNGANTYNGPTVISGGTLDLNNPLAVQNSTLTMNGGGVVSLDGGVAGNAFTLGGLAATNSGTGYNLALQNSALTAVALTIGNNNANTLYGGVLSGAGSLIKSGTGTLTLTNANTYTGNTIISAGTLALSGTGSISNTPLIGIANGATFSVSGLLKGFVLGGSQMLSNSAAATGRLAGNITNSTGIISVSYTNGTPAFAVTNGILFLTANSAFNINNVGPALGAGNYVIITNLTGGSVGGSAPLAFTVNGGGVAAGTSKWLVISNSNLHLMVAIPTKATTTTLTLSTNISSYGQSIIFTANVLTNGNIATGIGGTVSFYDGVTRLGTVIPISGVATLSIGNLTAGLHSITAIYSGDSIYIGSSSGVLTQTVNQLTPTITALPTACPITYGQTLASSTLSGGTASVAGSFVFTTPNIKPNAGVTNVSVTFIPTDITDYNTVITNLNVTVNLPTVANGLVGNYYSCSYKYDIYTSNYDIYVYSNLAASQTNATINFNWGSTPPFSLLLTNYLVRWTGQVMPLYSETYTFQVTANPGARLWVNNKLLVARTVPLTGADTISGTITLISGRSYNLMLEYYGNGATNSNVQLAWSSPSQPAQVIPSSQLLAVPPATPDTGSIREEYWMGLTGTNLTTLTTNTNYPNHPSGRELLTSFESLAPNWTTNLGTRVSGWLVPLTNGNYQFAVAAADTAQLSLSTDATTNNKVVIASVPSASGFAQFNTFPSQQSAAIPLVGGQKYFIELLQKASTNSSYYSVAWQPPGGAGFTVIPGDYLAPNGLHTPFPNPTNLFDTLATARPRLMTSPERFVWLQQCIASNSPAYVISNWLFVSNAAAQILGYALPTSIFDTNSKVGNIQTDMQTLGTAYFVTGNTNFAERAWLELSNVCTFPSWNYGPTLPLAQGPMTFGAGIGYDWFYNYLTPARRNSLTNAMLNAGVAINLSASPLAWTPYHFNTGMVLNNGSSALAIALANDTPTASQILLNNALTNNQMEMGHFTTDNGGYCEGPTYWGFGVIESMIPMLAGVESSLGTLFSIDDTPGFSETALYINYNSDPSPFATWFDYSDSEYNVDVVGNGVDWLSRRFNKPAAAWYVHSTSITIGSTWEPFLWYEGRGTNMAQSGYSPDNYFRGPTSISFQNYFYGACDVSTARTKWNDTNASFLGFKTGSLANNHSHLDAGSYIYEALGCRWFTDLGYAEASLYYQASNIPFSSEYRIRAEGHNTLVFSPDAYPDQNNYSSAPIIYYSSEPNGDQTVNLADLTTAYAFTNKPGPARVWRGTKLFNNRTWLMVQDEITYATPQTVWWFAHFPTNGMTWGVSPDGSAVTLTNGNSSLWVKLLTGNGSFAISNAISFPTTPVAPQDDNSMYRKIALNLTNITNTTITVLMVPMLTGDSPPQRFPSIVPLAGWPTNDITLQTNPPPFAFSGSGTVTNTNYFNLDLRSLASDANTPSNQWLFTVSQVSTGSVALLADGHTARFTPPTNYTGLATFNYTVNDQWMDSRLLFYYDFQPGNWTNAAEPNDISGRWHDGTFNTNGTGIYSNAPIVPASLSQYLSQSARLVGSNGTNGARLTRGISTAEWNFSQSSWTFYGWFRCESLTAPNDIFYIGSGNGQGLNGDELALYGDTSHNLILNHWNSSNLQDVSLTVSGVVNTGVWNQVAITFTCTNGTSGLVQLYLNGVAVASQSGVSWNLNQSLPVRLGAHAQSPGTSAPWFNGELADVAMFKGALSSTEIASLTNRTVAYLGGGLAANIVSLNVVSASPPIRPVIGNIGLNGSKLVLNGSNGTAGNTYYVLSSTNLALPMTNWTVMMTDQFNAYGGFSFTNTISQTNHFQFYRILSQ